MLTYEDPGKYYKVLQGNQSCNNGSYAWSLPVGKKPGDWTTPVASVLICQSGYHLTPRASLIDWIRIDRSVYEAESAPNCPVDHDSHYFAAKNIIKKSAFGSVRLLKLVMTPKQCNRAAYLKQIRMNSRTTHGMEEAQKALDKYVDKCLGIKPPVKKKKVVKRKVVKKKVVKKKVVKKKVIRKR